MKLGIRNETGEERVFNIDSSLQQFFILGDI